MYAIMRGLLVLTLLLLLSKHCSGNSPFTELSRRIEERKGSILDFDTTDCLPSAVGKFKMHVKKTSDELLGYAQLYTAASSDMADLISKFRHFHLSKTLYKKMKGEGRSKMNNKRAFRVLEVQRNPFKRKRRNPRRVIGKAILTKRKAVRHHRGE